VYQKSATSWWSRKPISGYRLSQYGRRVPGRISHPRRAAHLPRTRSPAHPAGTPDIARRDAGRAPGALHQIWSIGGTRRRTTWAVLVRAWIVCGVSMVYLLDLSLARGTGERSDGTGTKELDVDGAAGRLRFRRDAKGIRHSLGRVPGVQLPASGVRWPDTVLQQVDLLPVAGHRARSPRPASSTETEPPVRAPVSRSAPELLFNLRPVNRGPRKCPHDGGAARLPGGSGRSWLLRDRLRQAGRQ